MKRILLFCIIFSALFTTSAKCDRFILNGDTTYINSDPLRKYPLIETLLPKLANFGASCYDCFCFRYDAEWSIINDELYLTNIYSCPEGGKHLKADINDLFGVLNGKVKAYWVTDILWVPKKGRPIAFADMTPIYRAEFCIRVTNGMVNSIKEFDYSTSVESNYSKNYSALNKFLEENIEWKKIPDLKDQIKRVMISFENSASGKPENIRIIRGADSTIYNEESVRVVAMLPWNIYYMHGKVFKQGFAVPITFSEVNRQKYAH